MTQKRKLTASTFIATTSALAGDDLDYVYRRLPSNYNKTSDIYLRHTLES
jgi:hypothetical protein